MSNVADLAVATISQAQRRVEVAAQNLANVTTPAYKRRVAFSALVNPETNSAERAAPETSVAIDFRIGKLSQTGNPADLAIAGAGYFVVRGDAGVLYTRQGRFTIDADGRLVDPRGFSLQLTNGDDLIVKSSDFRVASDGTVTEHGEILGRIAVMSPSDERRLEPMTGGFRASSAELAPAEIPLVRQGAIETSNVSTGDEMVTMMEALRRAESGQRVMNIYDDLMGRVITSFGEGVR